MSNEVAYDFKTGKAAEATPAQKRRASLLVAGTVPRAEVRQVLDQLGLLPKLRRCMRDLHDIPPGAKQCRPCALERKREYNSRKRAERIAL